MNHKNWPKIRDLPEDEKIPFSHWLTGKTVPIINGPPDTEQDAFYPWDYKMWKSIQWHEYK